MPVHSLVSIIVENSPEAIDRYASPRGKPFLKLTAGSTVLRITTNAAEMIGGAGAGVRRRMEDAKDERYPITREATANSLEALTLLCERLWPEHAWLVRRGRQDDEGYFCSICHKDFVGGIDDPADNAYGRGPTPSEALLNAIMLKRGKTQ